MTKRYSYFKSEITGLFVIVDELHKETFSGMENEYNCSRIVRKLNTLSDENEQLKSFIKSLASPDGRIWLDNGYGYRISKILNGDVE